MQKYFVQKFEIVAKKTKMYNTPWITFRIFGANNY